MFKLCYLFVSKAKWVNMGKQMSSHATLDSYSTMFQDWNGKTGFLEWIEPTTVGESQTSDDHHDSFKNMFQVATAISKHLSCHNYVILCL